MFTKEQLAKWRSEGFPFPPDYDGFAVEKPKELSLPISNPSDEEELNNVEIEFVKFLFKIRNSNFYKKLIPYQRFRGPKGNVQRDRVFIAGKIFPVMNLFYSGEDADATKIEIKQVSTYELRLLVGEDRYMLYNVNYISIDNNKIKLFLPKSILEINYERLMLDFLTNGKETAHTIGGEFPDYETYKLALRNKAQPEDSWEGEDGCWLINDRSKTTTRWLNGYTYIVKYKIQGRLAPFAQIYDFYNAVDSWIFRHGHRVKWCKGAKSLVNALKIIDGLGNYFVENDLETLLNELNLGICDYAIVQFYDLFYGKYNSSFLQGDEAYEWDKQFIIYEQGTVAPPLYKKTSNRTINKFQNMVDHDPKGYTGITGLIFSALEPVTPAFDDFDPPAKVTDFQFRIDLPLLMLYLDKHKPTAKSFINHLNPDGTLNDEYKKIIKPYAL